MLTAGVRLGDMLRHRDLLSQHAPLCVPQMCSVLYSCLCLLQLQPPASHPTPSTNVCLGVFFCVFPGPYQAWCSGSDHSDQGRAASTLSQLTLWSLENSSAPWLPSTITLMTMKMMPPERLQRVGGDREHSHHRHCFGLCSHSSLFGIYFRRGAALLLSLYLGL